jgi:hypothetical protein
LQVLPPVQYFPADVLCPGINRCLSYFYQIGHLDC